jgi:hypothetical protein
MESRSFEMMPGEVVHNMIAARAYEIYQLRGGEPGREAEDWLLAEREILAALSDLPMAEDVRKSGSKLSKRTRVSKKSSKAPTAKKEPRKQRADPSIV